MANIYKDADKRRRVKPGNQRTEEAKPTLAATEAAQGPQITEQVITNHLVEEKPAEGVSVAVSDVLEKIQSKKKPTREKGPITLYLGNENLKKLGAAAKKANMSRSEFLDHILSEVLK